MARESIQHKIDRVRRPRVHITYDVETGGAIEKKEIPFVVGILADLSAESEVPKPKIADRNFDDIDRDNVDDIMAKCKPQIAMKVTNRLTGKEDEDAGLLNVKLEFNRLSDFHPENVANQVEPLRKLLDLRKKLSSLQNSMTGNAKLESLLRAAIEETERKRLQK